MEKKPEIPFDENSEKGAEMCKICDKSLKIWQKACGKLCRTMSKL